jgi:hypothetical protein
MAIPTVFIDDSAVTARQAEVPDAVWNSGAFGGTPCGIGISNSENQLQEALMPPTDGSPLVDSGVGSWSLLDQHGNVRIGQIGQNIGGQGYTDPADYPSSGGQEGTEPDATIRWQPQLLDGTGALAFPAPNAELETLQQGWRQQAVAGGIVIVQNNTEGTNFTVTAPADSGSQTKYVGVITDRDGHQLTQEKVITLPPGAPPGGWPAETVAQVICQEVDTLAQIRATCAGATMNIVAPDGGDTLEGRFEAV